jgi:septum site-determining protein MinC
MNQQQAESKQRRATEYVGTNGLQAGAVEGHGDDFLSMLSAVSALLDDVTVSGARPPASSPRESTIAPAQPNDLPPAAPSNSALGASVSVEQAYHEAPAPSTESSPGSSAWVSAVQVDDRLRPPWEMEERTTFDAPQQPAESTPSPLDAKPVWSIPASLFEPATSPASEPTPVQEAAPPPTVEAPTLPDIEPNAITIRGKNQGVSIEIGVGAWPSLMVALGRRLEQASGFFRGGHVAVDVGARSLTEPELKTLFDLLKTHGMDLGVLRTVAERTFQSALALGISATHETMEGSPAAIAQRANTNEDRYAYFVYRGNLRSGQVLDRRDHVVVIGDVNPGAEVISDGDIMVWGRLRGIAHAGARGNGKSIVAALELDPVQLRINTMIAISPGAHENGSRRPAVKSGAKRAEIARLVENRLVIEPWDEARTMGSPLLKRLRE